MKKLLHICFLAIISMVLSMTTVDSSEIWVDISDESTVMLKCSEKKLKEISTLGASEKKHRIYTVLADELFHIAPFQACVGYYGPRATRVRVIGTNKELEELLADVKLTVFIAEQLYEDRLRLDDMNLQKHVIAARVLLGGMLAQLDESWVPYLEKICREFEDDNPHSANQKSRNTVRHLQYWRICLNAYVLSVLSDIDGKWIAGYEKLIQSHEKYVQSQFIPCQFFHLYLIVRSIFTDTVDEWMTHDPRQMLLLDIDIMHATLYRSKIREMVKNSGELDDIEPIKKSIIEYCRGIESNRAIENLFLVFRFDKVGDFLTSRLIQRAFLSEFIEPDTDEVLFAIASNVGKKELHLNFVSDILIDSGYIQADNDDFIRYIEAIKKKFENIGNQHLHNEFHWLFPH